MCVWFPGRLNPSYLIRLKSDPLVAFLTFSELHSENVEHSKKVKFELDYLTPNPHWPYSVTFPLDPALRLDWR